MVPRYTQREIKLMGSPAPSTDAGSSDNSTTDNSNSAANGADTSAQSAGTTGGSEDAKPVTIPDAPDRSDEGDNANTGGSTDGDAEPGTAGEPITRD